MKITTVSKAEYLKECLAEKSEKELIYEFGSGAAKDFDILRKYIEQLHTEINELKSMIERIENNENSKAETANTTVDP